MTPPSREQVEQAVDAGFDSWHRAAADAPVGQLPAGTLRGSVTDEVCALLAQPAEAQGAQQGQRVVLCGCHPKVKTNPHELGGCGEQIKPNDVYRCLQCDTPFHRHCLKKHFSECQYTSYEHDLLMKVRTQENFLDHAERDLLLKMIERAGTGADPKSLTASPPAQAPAEKEKP